MTLQIDEAMVLEALQDEVRARRLVEADVRERSLRRDLRGALEQIELARVVSAHLPLGGRTLGKRVIGVLQKVTRRLLRWYINPIAEQQNAYNTVVAQTLRLLADSVEDLEAQTAARPQAAPLLAARSTDPLRTAELLQTMVRERAGAEPPAHLPDLALAKLEQQLRLRQEVTAHWPLGGTTPLGRFVAVAHKLVRRYLRWYINPIVEQQNAANSALTAALVACIRLDAERRAVLAARRASDCV